MISGSLYILYICPLALSSNIFFIVARISHVYNCDLFLSRSLSVQRADYLNTFEFLDKLAENLKLKLTSQPKLWSRPLHSTHPRWHTQISSSCPVPIHRHGEPLLLVCAKTHRTTPLLPEGGTFRWKKGKWHFKGLEMPYTHIALTVFYSFSYGQESCIHFINLKWFLLNPSHCFNIFNL